MGRRRALLVATYEYADAGLRQLTTPAQDAEALAAVLEDPEIAGFDVRILINESTQEVGEAIGEFYASSERDDLTLLYFSGHGLKDDNGRLYLAMKNTKRDNLRFSALSAELVNDAVSDSRARQQILVLDCCYSGAYAAQRFGKADSAVHTGDELGGRGRIVLTATDSTQYAFEGSTVHGEAAQSVFTRHLVEGLRTGAADLDDDGDVTVDELYDYVYKAVVAEEPSQRPKQFADVEGRTVIAANPHWRLPDRITAALDSPLAALRETGLQELGQLLQANSELVRRTARARLEQLLDDDSRIVATTARALLDAPVVRRQPTVVPPRSGSTRVTGPTFGAAARASVRRWRARLHPPEVPWLILVPLVVAAGAAVAAAVVGFDNQPWYLTAVAAVLVAAVVAVTRGRAHAPAFAAGLAAPSLAGAALLIGSVTHRIGSDLKPLPAALALGAHVVWLVAGVMGVLLLRRAGDLTTRRRPALLLLALGAVVAIAILAIAVDEYRHLRYNPIYPAALDIAVAELAIAGPLVAGWIKPARPFLIGWVLGHSAVLIGLLHAGDRFASPRIAVVAVLAFWPLVGLAASRSEWFDGPSRRWVMAATLLAPVVLGGTAVAVVPPAPDDPLALGLVVSQDDQFLYATDVANHAVLKISTTTRAQVGKPLRVGQQPSRMVLSPDGTRLYVANTLSNSISVIDLAAWKVVGDPIPVAPAPSQLALNAATQRLYVLSEKAQTITVIDTATRTTVGGPLSSGPSPADLAVDARGDRLFVANEEAGTVAVIDAKTRKAANSPIKVGAGPRDLALGPDGSLYVIGSTTYSVINTNVEVSRPMPVQLSGKSRSAGVSEDGKHLVVLGTENNQDTVAIVDTGKRAVVASLMTDLATALDMAVSGDGQRIYVSRLFQPGIQVLDADGPKVIGTIELTS